MPFPVSMAIFVASWGLAALAAYGLSKRGTRKTAFWRIFLIGGALLYAGGRLGGLYLEKRMLAEHAISAALTQVRDHYPVFARILGEDAARKDKLVADARQAFEADGLNGIEQVFQRGAVEAAKEALRYAPMASPESNYQYMSALLPIVETSLKRNPAACREAMLSPGSGGGAAAAEAEGGQRKLSEALERIYIEGRTKPATPPSDKEALPLLDKVFANGFYRLSPAEVAALRSPSQATDAKVFCAAMVKISKNILALPPADGGNVTRFIQGRSFTIGQQQPEQPAQPK